MWVPSNHHVPPARASDLAWQPPILIYVGTLQTSCATSTGIRPCMPAPHPNLCGCLPTIICCQQGYHTLHASPPPRFFCANSKHLPRPTEVANLACNIAGTQGRQPVFWISEHNFRAQFPSVLRYPSFVQPCMQYREHCRHRGQHQNFRALLEHGLPWVTVFGPTSVGWALRTLLRAGVSKSPRRIHKLLSCWQAKKKFRGEGFCDMCSPSPAPTR